MSDSSEGANMKAEKKIPTSFRYTQTKILLYIKKMALRWQIKYKSIGLLKPTNKDIK